MSLYVDNAATSYPKPQIVYDNVMEYMTNIGGNSGRGGSSSTLRGNRIIFDARQSLCDFFHFDKEENIIFTPNITYSLNMLIKGSVQKGWHVITSEMDHNSTLRTLFSLKDKNIIELDVLRCNENGEIDINDLENAIKSNTKLLVISHGSNIVGSIQPIEKIGAICKKHNIHFIIDSAQTAGVIDIDFYKTNCSALAFTGHKSLFGPQGTGGFLISDEFNKICTPIIEGGTGSSSSSVIQPEFLPDKFESGTMNTAGIYGLMGGINFINKEGINNIREHELILTERFINKALNIKSLRIYGKLNCKDRVSTISINSTSMDNSELGFLLDNNYGIITRTGLHCAPLAHKAIGTFPNGTLRLSFGYFNTIKDVDYIIDSLTKIFS